MPVTAAIILGGGALAGAGSIIGGNQASKVGRTGNLPAPGGILPESDPVFAALELESLLQLGQPLSGAGVGGSPVARILNTSLNPAAGDLRREDIQKLNIFTAEFGGLFRSRKAQGLSDADAYNQAIADHSSSRGRRWVNEGLELFNRIAAAAGFDGAFEALSQDFQFREQRDAQIAELESIAPQVRAGRLSALEAIANFQQTFGELDPEIVGDTLRRELEQEREEENERILTDAQRRGINPAGIQGKLEESFSDRSADIPLRAIEIANALTAGRGQALGLFQQSLIPAQQLALSTTQSNPAVTAGQIAASQAAALSGIQAGQDAASAQARGAGTAGAFNSIADALTLAGLMREPGTGGNANVGNAHVGSNIAGNVAFSDAASQLAKAILGAGF